MASIDNYFDPIVLPDQISKEIVTITDRADGKTINFPLENLEYWTYDKKTSMENPIVHIKGGKVVATSHFSWEFDKLIAEKLKKNKE